MSKPLTLEETAELMGAEVNGPAALSPPAGMLVGARWRSLDLAREKAMAAAALNNPHLLKALERLGQRGKRDA